MKINGADVRLLIKGQIVAYETDLVINRSVDQIETASDTDYRTFEPTWKTWSARLNGFIAYDPVSNRINTLAIIQAYENKETFSIRIESPNYVFVGSAFISKIDESFQTESPAQLTLNIQGVSPLFNFTDTYSLTARSIANTGTIEVDDIGLPIVIGEESSVRNVFRFISPTSVIKRSITSASGVTRQNYSLFKQSTLAYFAGIDGSSDAIARAFNLNNNTTANLIETTAIPIALSSDMVQKVIRIAGRTVALMIATDGSNENYIYCAETSEIHYFDTITGFSDIETNGTYIYLLRSGTSSDDIWRLDSFATDDFDQYFTNNLETKFTSGMGSTTGKQMKFSNGYFYFQRTNTSAVLYKRLLTDSLVVISSQLTSGSEKLIFDYNGYTLIAQRIGANLEGLIMQGETVLSPLKTMRTGGMTTFSVSSQANTPPMNWQNKSAAIGDLFYTMRGHTSDDIDVYYLPEIFPELTQIT